MSGDIPRCPDCGTELGRPYSRCPTCALPLTGPTAGELWRLDSHLADLEQRRIGLLQRREVLLARLRANRTSGVTESFTPLPLAATPARAPKDLTARAVQNLLLSLGGVLLTIAAMVFTVVSWGHMSIGGRTAVLLAFTGVALGVPAFLLRRRMEATAETIAMIGLGLLLLDGYAARRVGLAGLDRIGGLQYAAVVIALVAAIWVVYSYVLPLVLARPTALVLTQLPLPLFAIAMEASGPGVAAAFLLTAALDLAILSVARGTLKIIGASGYGITWVIGWIVAVLWSLSDSDAAGAAGALVLAAVLGLVLAWRLTGPLVEINTALAAISLALAAAAPVRALVAQDWRVAVYSGCAIAVLAVSLALPLRVRTAGAIGSGIVALGTVLMVAVDVISAVTWPLAWAGSVWTGAQATARESIAPGFAWEGSPQTAVVLGLGAAAATGAALRLRTRPWAGVAGGAAAITLGLLAGVVAPLAADLSYGAAIAVLLLLALALLLVGARSGAEPGPLAGSVGGWVVAVLVVAWSLAARPATYATLLVLLAGFAGASGLARSDAVRAAFPPGVMFAAGGLAWSVPMGYGWPARHAAFVVLGVAALGMGAAALMARRHEWQSAPTAVSVEVASYGVGALGLGLAVEDERLLSIGCAVAGILAFATALRPDRQGARYVGMALLLIATWLRLWIHGIRSVEAYTVPFSVIALGLGSWARRQRPELSSWAAYAPGLAFTLIPSLIVAWDDRDWARPLMLGVCALLVTLIGARFRLQAVALLGGGVLIVLGLHELVPWIAQVLGLVPRWLPPAVIGLLLLGIGATYERRLANVRRLRDAVGRMS